MKLSKSINMFVVGLLLILLLPVTVEENGELQEIEKEIRVLLQLESEDRSTDVNRGDGIDRATDAAVNQGDAIDRATDAAVNLGDGIDRATDAAVNRGDGIDRATDAADDQELSALLSIILENQKRIKLTKGKKGFWWPCPGCGNTVRRIVPTRNTRKTEGVKVKVGLK